MAHCFNMDGWFTSQTITEQLSLLLANGIRSVMSAPMGVKDNGFSYFQISYPVLLGLLF